MVGYRTHGEPSIIRRAVEVWPEGIEFEVNPFAGEPLPPTEQERLANLEYTTAAMNEELGALTLYVWEMTGIIASDWNPGVSYQPGQIVRWSSSDGLSRGVYETKGSPPAGTLPSDTAYFTAMSLVALLSLIKALQEAP